MKNKMMLSLIAASVITGSAFADMANVEGLTTAQIFLVGLIIPIIL